MFAGNNFQQVHSQKGLGHFLPISLLGCWAQQCPRRGWMGFGATWSSGSCPCPEQGVGMRWCLRSLPTKTILWVYDSPLLKRPLTAKPIPGRFPSIGITQLWGRKPASPHHNTTPSLGLVSVYKWRQPGRKTLSTWVVSLLLRCWPERPQPWAESWQESSAAPEGCWVWRGGYGWSMRWLHGARAGFPGELVPNL